MKIIERFINLIEKRIELKLFISIALLLLSIFIFQKGYLDKGIALSLFALISAGCFYLIKAKIFTSNWFIWVVYAGIGIIAILKLFMLINFRINSPAEWDFTVFYLFGKVGASGYNIYSPQDFHTVCNSLQLPFTVSKEFTEEIVNVGFWYPPQTMFYFLPLSAFSFKTALTLWTIIQTSFLFGCIYLIYSLFLKAEKLNGLLLTISLVLLFYPVKDTIICSQTNFTLLFFLLLIYKYNNKQISGVLLALAVILKPFMIIFIFAYLYSKNWKPLISFIITSIILAGITVIVYGIEPFLTYILHNPTSRLPDYVYSEYINQSLKAFLVRSHLMYPLIFGVISLIFLIITGYIIHKLSRKNSGIFVWSSLLLFVLLVYPATLSHYGVLLLFPLFHLLFRNTHPPKPYLSVLFIVTFFIISIKSVFIAICLCMLVLLFYALLTQFPAVFEPIQRKFLLMDHE